MPSTGRQSRNGKRAHAGEHAPCVRASPPSTPGCACSKRSDSSASESRLGVSARPSWSSKAPTKSARRPSTTISSTFVARRSPPGPQQTWGARRPSAVSPATLGGARASGADQPPARPAGRALSHRARSPRPNIGSDPPASSSSAVQRRSTICGLSAAMSFSSRGSSSVSYSRRLLADDVRDQHVAPVAGDHVVGVASGEDRAGRAVPCPRTAR